MGLRFRKTINILPGVRLNISKSGVSTSVGKRGATLNFSNKGTRATVGIPGSGISYSTMLGKSKKTKRTSQRSLNDSRRNVMQRYGITKSELKRFERRYKRNPRKFKAMSEAELVAYIKGKGKKTSSGIKKFIFVLIIVCLVYKLVSPGNTTNKKPTSFGKAIVSEETEKPGDNINENNKPRVTAKPRTTSNPKATANPRETAYNAEKTEKPEQKENEISDAKTEVVSDNTETTETTNTTNISPEAVTGVNYLADYEEVIYLKGRGLVDIAGYEPKYNGVIGYAAVYTDAALENDPEYTTTPWSVPVYEKKDGGWEQIGSIDHKTRIGIVNQELIKKNGKEYQGYLQFQDLVTGTTGYINVINFVTTPYWEEKVIETIEKGYSIAVFTQKSKYKPILQSGKNANISENSEVLLLVKGSYFISPKDKQNYQVLGIVYSKVKEKTEKQYIFFNADDLELVY